MAGGQFFILKGNSDAWEAVDSEVSVPESGAVTAPGEGKLFVVQGAERYALILTDGRVEREALTELPEPIEGGRAVAVGTTLYVAGRGVSGDNLFFSDTEKLESWSEVPARRILITQLKGSVYLFADEDGTGRLSVYSFNSLNKTWEALGVSEQPVVAEEAFGCGDAHILFVGPGSPHLVGYYATLKQWVEFPMSGLPVDDFALLADYRDFTLVTSEGSLEGRAVFPGTKYGIWDHLIVAAFFLLMLWVGKHFSKRGKNGNDFFRGGQRLPTWAVGLSLFATGASAISLMALPAKAYMENWIYFSIGLVHFMLLPLVFFLIIPITRRLQFSSAFEYLEARYCRNIRMFGSMIFALVQLMGRMATVLLLPAIAISVIAGIPIWLSILIMGGVTTVYCMMGGFEAVVWTDVIQAFMILASVLLCFGWAIGLLDVSPGDAMELVGSESKLQLADFSWDVTQPIFAIIILGNLFSILILFGDQNFVQRVQAVSTERAARMAVVLQLSVAIPLNALLFFLGTLLFVFYYFNPADISPAMKADGIFPLFAAQKLPTGLAGVVIASLMAATMSTLSSALNSVSNVAVEDYVKRFKPDLSPEETVIAGKVLTVVLGVVGTALAIWLATSNATSIFDLVIMVTGIIFAPMGSMFILGVMTIRVHTGGLIAGFIAGTLSTYLITQHIQLHAFFFSLLGAVPTMIVAYLFSVLFPRKTPRDLTGLTVYSLPPRID